jgi:hypothetical protein
MNKKAAKTKKQTVVIPQGMIPKVRYTRSSWTGKTVTMERQKAVWVPLDGRFEQAEFMGRKVNVLCHDTDPKLPADFDYKRDVVRDF